MAEADRHSGLIIHPTWRPSGDSARGPAIIQLFGRLDDGRPFLVEDHRFRPYFFVHARNRHAIEGRSESEIRATELSSLEGDPLVRIDLRTPSAARTLRDELAVRGVATFESDLAPPYRYLMDHAIRSRVRIVGGHPRPRGGQVHFRNPEVLPCDAHERSNGPTHLSLDIETTPDADRILSIGVHGCGESEVHIQYPRPVAGSTRHDDEASMILAFAEQVRRLDPDLLLGWNVIDFDLRVIDARCRALSLPLDGASLGRVPGTIGFPTEPGSGRMPRAIVPGRMVLDGLALVRESIKMPDYRLDTVAQHVLGRGKLIDAREVDPVAEITRRYQEDPEALVAYNLEDARLVTEILVHEGLIELALQRSALTGMQLDRVGASIASFDLLYLPELRRRGFVAPAVRIHEGARATMGGAVLESSPGLFRNVAVFDFKSLYPSLMRTFDLDPLAMAQARGEPRGAGIVAPSGAHFSRDVAILPEVIERFMRSRAEARARGDTHASQAIKIMMNSMYGVFAAPGCRFFSQDLANAITGFGQQTLSWTRDAFEDAGSTVLYGDTDSVFVHLGDADADAARRAEQLRADVEGVIAARIRRDYDVTSSLELQLERIFSRFFMPRVRGGQQGSKKRYAGWLAEPEDGRHLVVAGLEAVRSDWPPLARLLQEGLLERLFLDQELVPFAAEVVERLRSGALDEALVYRKRIRKGSLDRYAGSSPPHVRAARLYEQRTGRRSPRAIDYVICRSGPEPLIPGVALPSAPDYAHYFEKVIRPITESILQVRGESFARVSGDPEQLEML